MQEARLSHGGVPDDDEAELVDPDGLHRSRAQRTLRPPHPPTRRRANKAAGTVRSAPPRRPPAGFQHIPAAAAATRSPPSLDGEAGPGRGRGVASGQGAGQGREDHCIFKTVCQALWGGQEQHHHPCRAPAQLNATGGCAREPQEPVVSHTSPVTHSRTPRMELGLEWSYARPRAGPRQLPWRGGAGTGWHRRAQAATIWDPS